MKRGKGTRGRKKATIATITPGKLSPARPTNDVKENQDESYEEKESMTTIGEENMIYFDDESIKPIKEEVFDERCQEITPENFDEDLGDKQLTNDEESYESTEKQADMKSDPLEVEDVRLRGDEGASDQALTQTQEVSKSLEREEKRYEWSRSYQFKGSQFEKVNKLNGKMCFVPAIPYSKTQFWNESRRLSADSEMLNITGGRLVYSVTNIAGPAISLDLYKIYDVKPDKEFDFMPQKTVSRGWKKDHMQDKFKFVTRFEKTVLEHGEMIILDSKHKQAEVTVAKLKDRQHIPCYLTILWDLDCSSEIQISLFNNIEYKFTEKDDLTTNNRVIKEERTNVMLPDDIIKIVQTWDDDDEFE